VVADQPSLKGQDKENDLPPMDRNEALEVIDPTAHITRSAWPGPRFWRYAKPHPHAGGIMLRGIVQPLLLLRSPIILWCSLQFGMYQVYYNSASAPSNAHWTLLTAVIAAMTSGVLAEPPYNFSPSAVGLTFVGPLIASIPGSILGGRLADAYAVRKARSNGGISEAEHKLDLFIVPLIGMIVGLLMMGLGPYYETHWIVFVLGTSTVNFMGPIATLLALAYAFDCFHSIRPENRDGPQAATQDAAPYLLTVILVGMTIAFGFVSPLFAILPSSQHRRCECR
jgi:MFS family permease